MKKHKLMGCNVALPTPFMADEIDTASYVRQAKRLIDAGVHSILALGSTSEHPLLVEYEKEQLLDLAKEVLTNEERDSGRKIPFIVGVSGGNITQTMRNILVAEKYEPDAILISVPSYVRPSQQGIIEYYTRIAESTSFDIVLYNVSTRAGVNIDYATTLMLAEANKNIVAVKECSGDLDAMLKLVKYAPPHFAMLGGNDLYSHTALTIGGVGYSSVIANVVPSEYAMMFDSFSAGDYDKALEIHFDTFELRDLLFIESSPVPVKYLLYRMGVFMTSDVRLPLTGLSEASLTKIDYELGARFNFA